ncbi:MAG: hypothetical protein H7327_10990 [Herminiimonas sp.]|nr:hypothetical protein [Herminiimonas sp.]
MMQPKIYIAATGGAAGVTSALLHLESESDVYGWFLEATHHQFYAAFFMLEDFYAHRPAVLYRSCANDAYGDWVREHPPASNPMRCPVPEGMVHELERLKSKLVHDWLFFDSGADSATELAAYGPHGPARRAVNIRSRKLSRLAHSTGGWHHWTPGFDQNVLDYLQKYRRPDRVVLRD